MDTTRIYKDKTTGVVIGRFAFAAYDQPEGASRGTVGTIYYFEGNVIPNQASRYILRTYSMVYDIIDPPVPYDIEHV